MNNDNALAEKAEVRPSLASYPDFSKLSKYYQKEFTKTYESHESYKGKPNGFAFMFGLWWALTKGVWLAALINAIISGFVYLVLGYGVSDFVSIGVDLIYACIFGFRGTYMYYCAYVKKKQIIA